jgi:hypothetical protein
MPNLLKAMHTLPIISRTLAAIDVSDLEKLSDAARKRQSPLFLPRLFSLSIRPSIRPSSREEKRSSTF